MFESLRANRVVLVLAVALAGYSRGGGGVPQGEMENDNFSDLVEQVEDLPIDLGDTTAWSKFSFTSFALKLPNNWQVSQLNEAHDLIKLANFPQSEPESHPYDPKTDRGKLKLIVEIRKTDLRFDEVKNSDRGETVAVAQGRAIKFDEGAEGFVIYYEPQSQEKVYEFRFEYDFDNYQEFADLVISTVSFHHRGRA